MINNSQKIVLKILIIFLVVIVTVLPVTSNAASIDEIHILMKLLNVTMSEETEQKLSKALEAYEDNEPEKTEVKENILKYVNAFNLISENSVDIKVTELEKTKEEIIEKVEEKNNQKVKEILDMFGVNTDVPNDTPKDTIDIDALMKKWQDEQKELINTIKEEFNLKIEKIKGVSNETSKEKLAVFKANSEKIIDKYNELMDNCIKNNMSQIKNASKDSLTDVLRLVKENAQYKSILEELKKELKVQFEEVVKEVSAESAKEKKEKTIKEFSQKIKEYTGVDVDISLDNNDIVSEEDKQEIVEINKMYANLIKSIKEFKSNETMTSTIALIKEKYIKGPKEELYNKFLNKSDQTISEKIKNEVIKTGKTVELENGEEYTIVINGDASKDGKVTITDLSKVKLMLLELKKSDEVTTIASDINGDDSVTITDLAKLKLYIAGIKGL